MGALSREPGLHDDDGHDHEGEEGAADQDLPHAIIPFHRLPLA